MMKRRKLGDVRFEKRDVYRTGDLVLLGGSADVDDLDEGVERERGRVLGDEDDEFDSSAQSIVVEVIAEDREDEGDDGIRDGVTFEQILGVVKRETPRAKRY